MTEFEFTCFNCNGRLVASEQLRNQRVKCPQCGCELIAEDNIVSAGCQSLKTETNSSAEETFSDPTKGKSPKEDSRDSLPFSSFTSPKTSLGSKVYNILFNLTVSVVGVVLLAAALYMIGHGIEDLEKYFEKNKEKRTREKNYAVSGKSLQEFLKIACELEAHLDSGISYNNFDKQLVKVSAAWTYFKSLNTDPKLDTKGIDNAIEVWQCAKKVWRIGLSKIGTGINHINASELTSSELRIYIGNVGKFEQQVNYEQAVQVLLRRAGFIFGVWKHILTDYIKSVKNN